MSSLRKLANSLTLKLAKNRLAAKVIRHLSYQHKRVQRREIEARLRASGQYGDEVMRGPFQGMVYPDPEHWASCRFEKIIGCYESEIHEPIQQLIDFGKHYSDVIIIGAAEGYYAVGFALVFPNAKIWAFEPTGQRVDVMKKLANLNSVDEEQLTIGGFCSPETLADLPVGDSPLVICDVDGYEDTIMDPVAVPWLNDADIVLELHDFLAPNVSGKVRKRFQDSHEIDEYLLQGTDYTDHPVLRDLPMLEIQALTNSDRPFMQNWYVMRSVEVPSRTNEPSTRAVPSESPADDVILSN